MDKKIKFNTIKRELTYEEKLERVREHNEIELDQIDEKEFVKRQIFEECIEMKCLKCDYEEIMDADIILELSEMYNDPYPILTCIKCGKDSFVPKDVYNVKRNKK